MHEKIVVLKFGSSVLQTSEDLPHAVHEIYRWYRSGRVVIVVVSAIGEATDRLLEQARELSPFPESYATAELLATGERTSAALLGIALDRSGIPARVVSPGEIRLTAAGTALDSELIAADVERVRLLLAQHPVLVIPGFIGANSEGRTHLLGRGGSDLTAVFLARALRAERCRLIKDVDGVYERDPAESEGSRPVRFAALNYSDALAVAGALIQPKAVQFLQSQGTRAEVAACSFAYESEVGPGPTKRSEVNLTTPSRVLLLGLGTVGFGVYRRLMANPQHFEVVGALVRDRGKYQELNVPAGLLRTRVDQIRHLRADIVVDALPGTEPSRELIEHFLSLGTAVVSACKALVAEHGVELAALARRTGATLAYAAAVGGATPMLETVEQARARSPLSSLAAVLNGTCNFVLDRCGEGASLREALTEARCEGFAEADSEEDLSGRDAERKLRILCRHAFGAEPAEIDVQRLDGVWARRAEDVTTSGRRLRQVARATNEGGRVSASVKFEALASDSPFARLSREWNGIEILAEDGSVHRASGRGAGRWPTTESLLADTLAVHRHRSGSGAVLK